MLTEVTATRYVTPLREGGSLPGDRRGRRPRHVRHEVHRRRPGAQDPGRRGHLRASWAAGSACGSPSWSGCSSTRSSALGEPDQEVQELLKASGGLNLGMDYLPGSLGFDPLAYQVSAREAGRVVWFDALINNVDRSWRNPNMLVWHGDLWLIDHGATMIWHHNWPTAAGSAAKPYNASDHALAPFAPDIAAAAAELAPLVTEELLTEVAADVPDEWLVDEPGFDTTDALRRAYVEPLLARARTIHERPRSPIEDRAQARPPPG